VKEQQIKITTTTMNTCKSNLIAQPTTKGIFFLFAILIVVVVNVNFVGREQVHK